MKMSKSVLAALLALVLVLSPLAGTITVNAAEVALTGLTNHSAGWSSGGIYISHNAHGATYNSDWSVEYKPVSADVIKLVRGGVTTSVGQPASGTLVVYSATEMYLKTAAWTITGNVLPFVDGDKIIIEGQFKHDGSGDVLNVERTEIVVRGSGMGINAIEASALSNHSAVPDGNGVYATMTADGAPYNADWSLEYSPVSADAYRVIRDGVETNIGQPGRGTLVRFSETDHYLKFSGWCVDNFTAQTSDIFIIEGFWKQNGGSATISIEKTYLYHDGSAWIFAKQLPATIDAGVMKTHESGMSGNGIYFRTAANDAPSNNDWSIEYKQTSADNIKIIRGGETISIGIADRPMFIKINECDYYLKLENWTIGEYGIDSTNPITTDDILIIEGSFQYENVTLNITKSYVYYNGSAWACSESESDLEKIYNVGSLSAHDGGGSGTGFHAIGAENDAPYDWAAEYAPTSKECIQIIRGGETIYRENTSAGAIIKFAANGYYVKFDTWIDSANYPLQAGDMIIIEGVFVGTGNYAAAEGVKIRIDKTYITYDGSSFRFAEKYINAGAMQTHESGMSGNGIYFRTAANDAPSNNDWSLEYKQTSVDNIKIVRNGETISIGIEDRPLLIKINECDYYLKLENWTIGDYAPITTEDMLIIEGEFVYAAENAMLNITKSYVYYDGSAWVCSTECPHPSQATVVEGAVAPTCTDTGLTEGKHCSVCNTVLVAQQTVAATGHSYKAVVTDPDCTNKGYTTYTCTVCGDTYTDDEVAANGHNYNAVVTAPTCTAQGYTTYTCSVCGDSYVHKYVAATGHTEVVDAAVAPTCTATGLTEGKHCSVCNAVLTAQNTVPALGHTAGQAVEENRVEPNCTNAGSYESVVYCTVCNVELSRNKVIIAANGHTPVVDAAVAATCTATGLTEGKHCSVCGEVLVAQETVPATGHSYTAKIDTRADVPTIVHTCHCTDKQEVKLSFSATSLTLENNFVVNFKTNDTVTGMTVGNRKLEGFTNVYAVFSYSERTLRVELANAQHSNGKYSLPCRMITPSQVGDEITAVLYGTYGDTEYSYTMTYSVAEYCNTMIGKEDSSAELKTLLADILAYCDAARAYTTYQEDVTVMTDAAKAFCTTSPIGYETVMGQTGMENPSATWKSASLIIGETTSIVFRVNLDGIAAENVDIAVTVGGSAYDSSNVEIKQITADDYLYGDYAGEYLIRVDGLAAHRMRETVSVILSSDGAAISKTVSYSIESYAYAKQNDSNDKLVTMLRAMMNYGDAAVAFKKTL